MYDRQLKLYQEGLDDNPAASEAKRPKIVSGAEIISQELDQLNQQYTDLVNTLLQRVNELKSLVSSQEGQKVNFLTLFMLSVISNICSLGKKSILYLNFIRIFSIMLKF